MEKSSIPNPGTEGKEKKKKKLTEGQKRRRNRYTFEKERKKREAAAAAAIQLTSSIPVVSERSVVFTSADLPLRPVATVGPPVSPIFPTTSIVPSIAPNPPEPVREQEIPDNQKVPCNNCYSANHFPSEEERVRKFIQRRREREFEQAARQKAINERRSRGAKEREVKEREDRERRDKDPRERRERERRERITKGNENPMKG
ncbi:ensconsin [Daphnia magna]|uniref:ensconsin n=1 Tax=Daphnia magna TaxID=35525 RepID=UPI001403EB85|nr:ensconsin [Daphnia magna]